MPKSHNYVFVLWGNKFEEATASIFITHLREEGLKVKVVGLSARRLKGAHGLALVPDLTLDQALPLATRAICVILPYISHGIKRLMNDPRLRIFLERASTNKATFVIGHLNGFDITEIGLFPEATDAASVLIYPNNEDLVRFARKLAGMLKSVI